MECLLDIGELVICMVWMGSKVILGIFKGLVKVLDSGSEVVLFYVYVGVVIGFIVYFGGCILVLVGVDKSFVFYDFEIL